MDNKYERLAQEERGDIEQSSLELVNATTFVETQNIPSDSASLSASTDDSIDINNQDVIREFIREFMLCCWEGGWCKQGKHKEMTGKIVMGILCVLLVALAGSLSSAIPTAVGAFLLQYPDSHYYFGDDDYSVNATATDDPYHGSTHYHHHNDDEINDVFLIDNIILQPSLVGGSFVMLPYLVLVAYLIGNTMDNVETSWRLDRVKGQSANITLAIASCMAASVVGQIILHGGSNDNITLPQLAKSSALGMGLFSVAIAVRNHACKSNRDESPLNASMRPMAVS